MGKCLKKHTHTQKKKTVVSIIFDGKNSEGPAENSWVLDLCPAK